VSAPTAAVEYLLARAAVRADGLMHVVSQRDTGALNPVCGANPVRSKTIDTWTTVPAGLDSLCADCAGLALRTPGVTSLEQGVAVWLGTDAGAAGTRLLEVPLTALEQHAARDEETLPALAASIRRHGVLQPVLVRRTETGYELVAGARRAAAAHLAGLASVPALVRDVDQEQAVLATLSENLHRADLNPIDQALAFTRALEQLELTHTELAARLEISRVQISNTIRLLELPDEVRDLVAAGAVGAAHARELLRLPTDADRIALAAQIAAEGLTVRETAARRGAAAAPAPVARLGDIAQLLTASLAQRELAAKVLVTTKGDRARITLDVAEADLARVLEQVAGITPTPIATALAA